ncbi:MAG: serine/threonine-protein kinase, partial [Myxococcota bacterium]
MLRDGPDRLPRDRYIATSELLGEGGMAKVWRVWNRARGTWCAVKILREKFVELPAARRRFINESRTLLRLSHRNVIAGWEVGEGEHPYLSMEVADGGTLKEWVIRHGAMPPRMAVGVAFQICKGLNAAHALGVIHRDVKPHNILVNRKGMCKVSDFGIARIPRDDGGEDVPDATTAQATDAMGTMGYMAPEQVSDPHRVDPRTDVYGVGATLFDLLTGHPRHNLFMAATEPEWLIEVPEVLRPVLISAVQYLPEDRYSSVLELAKELHAIRSALAPDPVDTFELAAGLLPEPAPPPGV